MASSPVADRSIPGHAFPELCGRIGDRLLIEHPIFGVVEAKTTMRFTTSELSRAIEEHRRAVVLECEGGMVVVGLLEPLPPAEDLEVEGDEEPLVLSSRKGVVLRCGEASIRLMPDGRVVVRGKDVLTRASRRNQIAGASVRLN
jgi:hypothetical protein